MRKEKLHKLNRFTEFICYGQKKARIPARATVFRRSGQKNARKSARTSVFRQSGQKTRRTMPRRDPPRRAEAQRTGNAGTGTPFFRRHGPALSPARRKTAAARAARAARAHNNEADPLGPASFMGRKWITARRGRCCRHRSRGRGRPGHRSQDLEDHPGRRSRDPEDHPEDRPGDRPGPAGRPGTSFRTPC